jgi:hypothetical protein
MSTRIERVRFFDGEYLRALDLDAEQAYHRLMRQRLNSELHLFGIVEGLELQTDKDSVPGAEQYNISQGMAIDQSGREMIVSQPYVLRGDVLKKKNLQAGENAVGIFYKQTASSLPSAGYAICNDPSQNTRWLELFDIVFIPAATLATTDPVGELVHPDTGEKGLRLGTITLVNNVNGFSLTNPVTEKRVYIGIRAGRVVHPLTIQSTLDPLKKNSDPKDPPPQGALDVEPAIFARQDIQAKENLFVGDDFEVKDADRVTKFPAPFPASGNVKIASNLILRGDMFASLNGKWYGLKDYVKSFLPEFVSDTKKITPGPNLPNPSTDTIVMPITSKLKFVTTAQVMVSLSGIELLGHGPLLDWWKHIGNDPIRTEVSATAVKKAGTDNQFDINFTWTVGPRTTPPLIADAAIEVKSLLVTYLIIFYP